MPWFASDKHTSAWVGNIAPAVDRVINYFSRHSDDDGRRDARTSGKGNDSVQEISIFGIVSE
jgi:hypothetical protein